MMNQDNPVGGTGLPQDVNEELSDLIARLSEKYYFKHGSTAAFFSLAYNLAQHLGEGKE
jgi:hypothetical protein